MVAFGARSSFPRRSARGPHSESGRVCGMLAGPLDPPEPASRGFSERAEPHLGKRRRWTSISPSGVLIREGRTSRCTRQPAAPSAGDRPSVRRAESRLDLFGLIGRTGPSDDR